MSGQPRRRNIRAKRETGTEDVGEVPGPSGEEDERSLRDKLEETRLIQRMRQKVAGTDASKLAVSDAAPVQEEEDEEEEEEDDHLHKLMHSYVKATSVRQVDDDEHMEKYVQEELARRLGKRGGSEEPADETRRKKIEADLYSVPTHLQATTNDVILGGNMTAITEVTLPMEDRLRNIEETEAMKRKMLEKAGIRAHMPNDDEDAVLPPSKMRRGELPIVFGKAAPRRRDQDPEELERLRRRTVSDSRPLFAKKPR